MENIEKTKDYGIFKYLKGNRPLNRNHVKKLKSSIENNNLLNLHPIIINEKFEIIDGQHRLECAKQLGYEIYFIQSDKVHDEHLIDCNVNQKSFEVENFVGYFATKDGNTEYIRLKTFMNRTNLKPKSILCLIIGNVSNDLLLFLKTGKFKLPTDGDADKLIDFYCDFIVYIQDKRIRPLSMFSNHYFAKALRWIYKTDGFEMTIFFKKLDLRWFDLKPQLNAEGWYKLLINIYNFKNHNKIEEEYGAAK